MHIEQTGSKTSINLYILKEQCHEIFCFRFFMKHLPQAPENNIRVISIFLENSWRYSQVKLHHRYQRQQWQICHRYQRHRRQILPPVPLVLLILLAREHYQTADILEELEEKNVFIYYPTK